MWETEHSQGLTCEQGTPVQGRLSVITGQLSA